MPSELTAEKTVRSHRHHVCCSLTSTQEAPSPGTPLPSDSEASVHTHFPQEMSLFNSFPTTACSLLQSPLGLGRWSNWLLSLLSSTCTQINEVTVKFALGLEERSHLEQAGVREGGKEERMEGGKGVGLPLV